MSDDEKRKKITFDSTTEEGRKIFEVVWDGFRFSYGKIAKGYDAIQVCNRVADKLKKVSTQVARTTAGGTDEFARQLRDNVKMSVLLTGLEFGKLKAMVENDEIQWSWRNGQHVEAAIKLLRGVEAAKDVDVEETEKPKAEVESD